MAGPGDLILEPNERVILATRPLFLWELVVVADAVLLAGALWAAIVSQRSGGTSTPALSIVLLVAAALVLVWATTRWIPWSRRWFVLTDRRVIVRWGVLNRNQAALLLDRIQDASISRPFPLSLIRDFGTLHLESAGEHAQERITGGLDELDMTNATAFYRALTDAQTTD